MFDEIVQRVFHCDCDCVQKNVYTVLAGASLIMMAGSVAGANDRNLKMQEAKNLILYLVVAVVVFLALEWLCVNNHKNVAWVLALLPLVAALLHGYRMARSGHFEANNLPRLVLQKYKLF